MRTRKVSRKHLKTLTNIDIGRLRFSGQICRFNEGLGSVGMNQRYRQQNEGCRYEGNNEVEFAPPSWDICITDEKASTHRTSKDSHHAQATGADGFNTSKGSQPSQRRNLHHKQEFADSVCAESGTSSVRRRTSSHARRVVQGIMRSYETSRRPQPKLKSPTCPALVCWECMGHRIGRQAITLVTAATSPLRFAIGTGLLCGESRALGK